MVNHHQRVWSVDLARGAYIFLMMLAHSIFFFHAKTNPLLQIINGFADNIVFTGLLILSGISGYIAYVHDLHPTKSVIRRILKRILVYLVGYYTLAIVADTIHYGWSLENVIDIFTLTRLAPFTEFIFTFIILGILIIPLRKLYQQISKSLSLTILAGLITFAFSNFVVQSSIIWIPTNWKNIIFGGKGVYSFPLMPYFLPYLLGLYLGRQYFTHQQKSKRNQLQLIITTVAGLIIIAISLAVNLLQLRINIFHRWPPSVPFILYGTAILTIVLYFIEKLHNLYRFPWVRNILLIFGQNAFALFFTHTLILYLFKATHIPLIHSSTLVLILWIFSIFSAIYLARILPLNYQFGLSFVRWCDCLWHSCSHATEHRRIIQVKKLLLMIFNLPEVLSFTIGKRKFRPLRTRAVIFFTSLFFLAVTPLGIAENSIILSHLYTSISGQVNSTWILNNQPSQLVYTITLPESVTTQSDHTVTYRLNDQLPQPMSSFGNTYQASLNPSNLIAGEYSIHATVTRNQSTYDTQATRFYVSEPLYVTWTIDWEGYDVSDSYLDALVNISELYQIPMTHLFNPRIYTSPDIASDRQQYLTQWVSNRRDLFGEEIGLHLHMFKDFVEDAGVTPRDEPYWNDGSGYDILTTAYQREELSQIINRAKWWFREKNLGVPRSYRAGAWFANLETLQALEDSGFLIDSSGRTKYSFGRRQIPGFWELTATTQPYFPSQFDQNKDTPSPQLKILEIPNNGADTYAFTAADLIDRFNQNYPKGILTEPKQITYLTHPHWFNQNRQQAIHQLFAHIKQFTHQSDRGPVVYTTLSQVYRAWVNK